ncbi:hypothetical protein, partial [Xanthomonas oryzae]|uniref:hypothetical protein n=1 Tax=Xanthomonas oryzae TaxID=347 RepID=UPI001ED995C8
MLAFIASGRRDYLPVAGRTWWCLPAREWHKRKEPALPALFSSTTRLASASACPLLPGAQTILTDVGVAR